MSVNMDTASLTSYNNTNFSLFPSGVSNCCHDFVLAGNHAHRVRGRVEELESIGRQFDGNRTALARLQVHDGNREDSSTDPPVSPTFTDVNLNHLGTVAIARVLHLSRELHALARLHRRLA